MARSYLMHMAEMRIKDEGLTADEAAALRTEARQARRVDLRSSIGRASGRAI